MASQSTIPRQKEGRRKTSELFPDDVKKFIVTLKKNNRPYIEIVDEAKKEFPGLDVKLHHCREIVLSESAHVSLTIEEKYQIVRLKDEGQHTWKQIADMFNIRPKRAQDIYRKNKDKIVDYRNACIGVKATAKVNFISVVYLPNLICLFCQAITKKRTPIHELTEFFSSMEIDTAIELVHSAWQDVPEHTIARSFSKCHPDNTSELVDRKEKTAKEAAKLLKEDAEFCQLNRRMEAPYNLSDIEAMLTETTEDLVDISTLTQEQIATVRRAMGIVVEPESGTPAGGPVQTDEHRHKRQKTDHQGDDVVASLEDSPDVSVDSFDMSLYEPDTLKRDVCKLYNAIATADTGTRSRYHSFVNDLAHLISSVSKN